MKILSNFMDFLSNKYFVLLTLALCLYFAYTTFNSVEKQKNNTNVNIIQVVASNKTENIHEPVFNLTPVEIDSSVPNPFLSSWLRQKSIEVKKRLEAQAEARKIALERKLEKEQNKKAEEKKTIKTLQKTDNNVDKQPKVAYRPRQKKQFRYIGHTLVNGEELILIEILENKRIHYISKDETIETYKVNAFDNEKLELIKDDKIHVIKRGNIILLET